ncbi:exonuclease 3 -5 domain-containing 1 [Trichoderma arundinaceum]|uniref:Exonuclease 3-5 domain-containing 1 n=1 Tax=Trichoderma arundinaceum TaxID=490622 RepID=A0A395NSP7_TRIAR|nr:exonuclease 3 -5 domain-containing 1 [Trichoderma arundinaceum]
MAEPKPILNPCLINTLEELIPIVDWLVFYGGIRPPHQPAVYMAVHGQLAGKNRGISFLTIVANPEDPNAHSHIIDIHTIGRAAFHVMCPRGQSLKDVLESSAIRKVLFDVRRASNALYALYDIKLVGVLDLQLMENAGRRTREAREFLSSLPECVEELIPEKQQRDEWGLSRYKGERLWNPYKGGVYTALNARPACEEILAFCASEVAYLPALFSKWFSGVARLRRLIDGESHKRAVECQQADYRVDNVDDSQRPLSPWSVDQNNLLDRLTEVRH